MADSESKGHVPDRVQKIRDEVRDSYTALAENKAHAEVDADRLGDVLKSSQH